jgi:hypothetical protein
LLFPNFISTLNSMHDPFCTIPLTNPLTPKFKNWSIFISIFFLLYENHGINFLQTYIQKMCISANSRGLWGDNHAIFCLANYSHRPIHVWSKKLCDMFLNKWCFHKSSTLKNITNKFFINNSTLELKFTQIYYHVHHLHTKKCKSCKKY